MKKEDRIKQIAGIADKFEEEGKSITQKTILSEIIARDAEGKGCSFSVINECLSLWRESKAEEERINEIQIPESVDVAANLAKKMIYDAVRKEIFIELEDEKKLIEDEKKLIDVREGNMHDEHFRFAIEIAKKDKEVENLKQKNSELEAYKAGSEANKKEFTSEALKKAQDEIEELRKKANEYEVTIASLNKTLELKEEFYKTQETRLNNEIKELKKKK